MMNGSLVELSVEVLHCPYNHVATYICDPKDILNKI